MSDTDTDHHARIFTKAEMDETWGMLLHQAVFGEGITEGFEFEEWMIPLCDIYRQHLWNVGEYAHDGVKDATELLEDCKAAYKAGLEGDYNSVDRFVGGHELSQLDAEYHEVKVKVIRGIIVEHIDYVSLSVLDNARVEGNMEATTPNEVNDVSHASNQQSQGSTSTS